MPRADLERHPQLGVYQLAIERGAFRGERDAKSGGAMLVQLGKDGKRAAEQAQPPLSESDDPTWAERLVSEAADGMAGSEFSATKNKYCTICSVRRSCPLHVEGGQVTP